MEDLIIIISLVWAILNIILFFKLWRACDDIRRIADKYDSEGKLRREEEKKHREEHAFDALPDMPDKYDSEGKESRETSHVNPPLSREQFKAFVQDK